MRLLAVALASLHGPFLLVSLPALGTVNWRCGDGFALGFDPFRVSADTYVRLHIGPRTIGRYRARPGRTLRLPFLRSRVQQLDFVQRTEPGTLRASVTVNFVRGVTYSYCWPYLPPRIDVRVLPRR